MTYLELPDNCQHKLPFYLAMEEFAASLLNHRRQEFFFMWRVKPSVIFGRCQIGSREVNLDYCRNNNIEVYRRKSGGGCVYADMDNIMFSYICRSDKSTPETFRRYTSLIAEFLVSLGIPASSSSRNDILINQSKVSGNAFYNKQGTSIVHGTMLYSTNLQHMLSALTPSKGKLESKGVESVQSRITTLNRWTRLSISEFMYRAKKHLCDSTVTLNDKDIAEIEKISEPYYTDAWRFGFDLRSHQLKSKIIPGVGEFFVNVSLDSNNKIKNIELAGDFFITGDISSHLVEPLIGVNPNRQALETALKGCETNQIIKDLNTEQYIDLLLESLP